MADFNIRSDSVNVEHIMEQVRARIREKRGVDYTEDQIRQLATVKLERFLDPRGVRSDLLEQFQRLQAERPALPTYPFEEETLYETHRAPLRWIRRLLNPILKLFFNPNAITHALHLQSRINETVIARRNVDQLYYEVLHNLVIEITRTSIEVKNLRMRVDSLASRLDFTDRRSRALESVVVYKSSDGSRGNESARGVDSPDAPRRFEQPSGPESPEGRDHGTAGAVAAPGSPAPEGPGQRSRRRRRRRGRRGGAPAATLMGPSPSSTTTPGHSGAGEGVGESDAEQTRGDSSDSTYDTESEAPDIDRRDSRPEPMEQAFGREAHPAEPVDNDPDDQQ